MMRDPIGTAVPGTRRWDSLAMALRAFELARIWGAESFLPGGAMQDRLDRTVRAAEYLYRRVKRSRIFE